MTEKDTKQLSVRIDANLHRQFKTIVTAKGYNMREVVETMVMDFLQNQEIPSTEDCMKLLENKP